jgi:ketosteroid isomerase-like protein
MKTITTLALGLALTACAPAPQPAAGLSEADKAAIMAQRAAYVQAVNAGDAASATNIFAQDGVALEPNAPAIEGKAAITKFYQAFPPVGDFRLYGEQIEASGDLVVIRGSNAYNMMLPGATTAIADTGKFVEVWKKLTDGTWKLLWDIGNSDRAPAPPPAE